MWLVHCPLDDQGEVRPLVTESGVVVLMCDSADEIWLHPSDIDVVEPIVARAPGWEVASGVQVAPGTSRWAEYDDLPDEWRQLEWHD